MGRTYCQNLISWREFADDERGFSGRCRAHGHQEAGRNLAFILDYSFHRLCNIWCSIDREYEAAAPDDAVVVSRLSQRPDLDCQLGDEPKELAGASDRVENVCLFLLSDLHQVSLCVYHACCYDLVQAVTCEGSGD